MHIMDVQPPLRLPSSTTAFRQGRDMEQLDQLVQQAAADFAGAADGAQLEQAKARYLGKAGSLTERQKSLVNANTP